MPSSGSLFQALGMNSSTTLHPNVHRLVIDEECIFLLCSDGLSDNNRVEQFWQNDVLPLLEGKIDLVTAGNRLINTANTRNGHDNSSIALIHCRVKQPRETAAAPGTTSLPGLNLAPSDTLMLAGPQEPEKPAKNSQKPLGLLLAGGLLAVVLAGGFVWQLSKQNTTAPTSISTPSEPGR
jgi:hypothetical protein